MCAITLMQTLDETWGEEGLVSCMRSTVYCITGHSHLLQNCSLCVTDMFRTELGRFSNAKVFLVEKCMASVDRCGSEICISFLFCFICFVFNLNFIPS